jgi:hypothetical protein
VTDRRPVYALYHGGCPDGITAAWCWWRQHGDDCVYEDCAYGREPTDLGKYRGAKVVFLDYSWPAENMKRLLEVAWRVVVVDHHKTAIADLTALQCSNFDPEALSRLELYVDTERSGARLAWDYLAENAHSDRKPERPRLIDYIEDNDLWRHELPEWEAAKAAIELERTDDGDLRLFERWQGLADRFDIAFPNVVAQGKAIVGYRNTLIQRLIHKPATTILAGVSVPCVNSPVWQSEIGEKLSEAAPFAVIWCARREGGYAISLRSNASNPEAVDVSTIAKAHGGGGHRHAAGFRSNAPPTPTGTALDEFLALKHKLDVTTLQIDEAWAKLSAEERRAAMTAYDIDPLIQNEFEKRVAEAEAVLRAHPVGVKD